MGYKVTDTQRITTMTPAGSALMYYRVWLVTDRGASGLVDVSVDDWNDKDLPPILKAESEKLDLAFHLKG